MIKINVANEIFEETYFENYGEIQKYINKKNGQIFLEKIKETNILPFSNIKLYYTNDIWDFSSLIKLPNAQNTKFYFSGIPCCYKELEKNYVLFSILSNNYKISTIQGKHKNLTRFFKYLYNKNIFSINDVDTKILKNFIMEIYKSETYSVDMKKTLLNFYTFYSLNFNEILTNEINTFLSTININ